MIYADLIDGAGNRLRFEEIYETYYRQMFFKANGILQDAHEAEDAVHEALIGIARNMKTVSAIADEQDLRYYVLRAAENAAYNRTRQTKQYTRAVPLEYAPHMSDGSLWEAMCTRMDYEALVDIIAAMPRIYREVLIVGEGSDKVLMYCSETMTVATWVYDGYFIKLSYSGKMDSEKVLALVASLAPMETGPSEK